MQRISLFIVALCIATGMQAQEGLKIGLRLSPIVSSASITNENGNDVPAELSSKLGITYGLMMDYGFTDKIGLHTGIHIVNKGFKRSETITLLDSGGVIENATQNVSMTTVEIPLALKGRSPEVTDGLYINGLFGLSVDISAGYKNEYDRYNPVTRLASGPGTTKNTKLINPLNFSFIFGLGAEYEIDRVGTFNGGIFYHRGLTNMNNRSQFGNQESIRVSYLSLDLGYFF
ncbi:MAG: hypothetical protein OHK0039_32610 [Bacteroidia bacterium]